VIILDTDALGHIQKKDPVGILIVDALDTSPDRDIRITAVTAYEMLEGASAQINRLKKERRDLILKRNAETSSRTSTCFRIWSNISGTGRG
jgi:predicted nucleic acid-binding protein